MTNIFRDYRRARGYSQVQLAEMLEVDQTTVSKWEHDVAYPRVSQLLALQHVLRISNNDLIAGLRKIEKRKGKKNG